MTREIPLCVLVPLRRARLGLALAGLLGCRRAPIWISGGSVPERHWQAFMAHAIALLECYPDANPRMRRLWQRRKNNPLVWWHRQYLRQWRARHPGYNREFMRRWRADKRGPSLYEALRWEVPMDAVWFAPAAGQDATNGVRQ